MAQINSLDEAGCDIVRVAVPDMDAAKAIKEIKTHQASDRCRYTLRLPAGPGFRRIGADKIRINPGNIGNRERVRAVVEACRGRGIPIRIGVNGGSVSKRVLAKYGGPVAGALVESALSHVEILEEEGFTDICISIKASSVPVTLESYRLMSEKRNYPLHLGVTEAGSGINGIVKSSVGIGTLLSEGIGDTIRVSLTDRPEEEVRAGIAILRALGLRKGSVEVVSCPTCGRTKIDLIGLVRKVEDAVRGIDKELKIAVMGCVQRTRECRDADIGLRAATVRACSFSGQVYKRVPYDELLDELLKLVGTFDRNEG